MAKINENFKKLPQNYLFAEIEKRTKAFIEANPGVEIFKLSIGNTTEHLTPTIINGLKYAVEKLSKNETYTGYGDEQGNIKLREALCSWYKKRNITIDPSEIFISDGAKPDCAHISSIFSSGTVIAISDPVYPVYLETSVIAGKKVIYLPASQENEFISDLPKEHADLIFLCSPNNPTGMVMNKNQLKKFVDFAVQNKTIIIFDAAYSEYIQNEDLPRSIYEISGSEKCAIEIQSFSKSAGFTGVRLGWTVVPKKLQIEDAIEGEVNQLYNRIKRTTFNGASNIAQEGGLAVLSESGQVETKEQIKYYLQNARIIKNGFNSIGVEVFGGDNAPYIWARCPNQLSSWGFFDKLLKEAHVICVPGSGFGNRGEGFVRFSAFGSRENIEKAIERIKNMKLRG